MRNIKTYYEREVTILTWMVFALIGISFALSVVNLVDLEKMSDQHEIEYMLLVQDLEESRLIIEELQEYDKEQERKLQIFYDMYDRDAERQEEWNRQFVTNEELQLEVERVVKLNIQNE